MTRDNIIGLVLIAVILIGYSLYMAPTEEERLQAQRQRDSIAELRQEQAEREAIRLQEAGQQQADPIQSLADLQAGLPADSARALVQERLRDQLGLFAGAALPLDTGLVTLENEKVVIRINPRGGFIGSVELKQYKTFEKEPLRLLFSEEDYFSLDFFSSNRSIRTSQLYFQAAEMTSDRVLMRAYSDLHTQNYPSYIEFAYQLSEGEYMFDFQINFVGMQDVIAVNTTDIALEWQSKLPRLEKNRENEQNNTTVFYQFVNDDVSRLRESRDGAERLSGSLRWISFKQQFFSSTLIAAEGFLSADVSSRFAPEEEDDFVKTLKTNALLAYDARASLNSYPMQMYVGPNHYRTFRKYELNLERQIPLGWGFFLTSWINRFLVIPVFNYLDGFNLNYGIIILLLTLMLKTVLMPIAYKTYTGQAKMRVLKPDIEELSKKFPKKEDAMKKQQATMSLYKKAGVNPMAGCVPMLLQLPILIALFRFFPASIELRQEAFLWADDLSSYDSILDLPFTIPFYGSHVSLFTLLMTVSTVLYTRMNSQMMGSSSQMPGMKTMMYFMPVMFLGIFNNFASGLSYYYFLANLITFGQMFLFRQFVDEKALRLRMEENKKKPVKKSKWAMRMEQLAKQQEMQQKKRK